MYCTWFWHKRVVYINTLDQVPPNRNHIDLETISPPLPTNPDYTSPQIIQEILKTCHVELEKFECYKYHKEDIKQLVYNWPNNPINIT